MSSPPHDREMPDEVSATDYLEQHTATEPGQDGDDVADDSATGSDELAAGGGGRVETDQLGLDAEADEADLLEQATSLPAEDGGYDQEE